MTYTVIGRPTDDELEGLRETLRRWRRNLTPREWMEVMAFDRRVRTGRAYFGRERRQSAA